MTKTININPLLDEIIKESGLTQEEIAKDLGYDRAYLSQARKEGTRKLQDKLVAYLDNVRKSKEDKGQKKSGPEPEPDYKEKYIALLEQRVRELETRQSAPPTRERDILDHLSKIEKNQVMILAAQRAFQEFWARQLKPKRAEAEQLLEEIDNKAVELVHSYLSEGISFPVGS